jgi:predicted dehydrogenase/acetyltransferase-like isoleucine patch superfamily enzyme
MPARIAVVGCGQWGKNLVRNFHDLGALAALADADEGAAARLAAAHGVPARPWDAILADPAIDAIALATPAETHAPLSLAALGAGKHVFVEKPLALRVTDGEEVCRMAAARGRVVMIGHLLQYHPAFLRLKELAAHGELGRIQYIYSNRLNLGRIRSEENVFWSFAPHDLSMILSLAGDLPDSVEASGHCYLHARIADVTTTILRFANGINAHVFVSWLHPFKEQKLVVVGDAGMAVFDDGEPWAGKLTLYPHKVAWRDGLPQPAKAEARPVALDEAEPLRLECRHFLDCVEGGRRPRTDAEEGLRVLRVLDAAERAVAAGHAVPLKAPAAVPEPTRPFFAHETALIDDGCTIGAGTRIWHFSHVLTGTRIGRDCVLGQNVMLGPDVTVGDRCKIQNNVSLYKGVVLEDGVFCGPSAVFTNVLTPRAEIERKDAFLPTRVGRGATIGANATIVCGHTLGAYCMVAAGAVVTRDVPPHGLVAGSPARRIGWVSHAGERLGPDLVCPRSGRRYTLKGEDRLEELLPVAEVA